MSKNLNYITGTILITAGALLVLIYKVALADNLILPVLFGCLILFGGGVLLIYVTRDLHKATDHLQQIEQSIEDGKEVPEGTGQIIITCANNGITVTPHNMSFQDSIAALEVGKLTLIDQKCKKK